MFVMDLHILHVEVLSLLSTSIRQGRRFAVSEIRTEILIWRAILNPPARTNHRSIDRYAYPTLRNCSRATVRRLIDRTEICKNGHQAQPADPEEPLPQGLVCASTSALHMRKLWLTFSRQRYVRVHFDQVNPLSLR
jgi:hypothetical protein